MLFCFLMIRQPPSSTQCSSSAASDVYKRQALVILLDVPASMLHGGLNFRQVRWRPIGAMLPGMAAFYAMTWMLAAAVR